MKQEIYKKLACLAAILTNTAYADKSWIKAAPIKSISEIQSYVDQIKLTKAAPEELCLIYDMDNTILSAEPSLASDSWMVWNNGLDSNNPDKISNWNLSNDTHGFEGALRFFIKYYPTESMTLASINNLKDIQRHPSIVMTARSYERYYAATDNQLRANNLDFTSNPIGKTSSFKTTISLTPNQDKTAYKAYFNGVYYSADDNKGDEIISLIKSQRENLHNYKLCKTVVFIDNSQTNINNVYNALNGNQEGINLVALHYSGYDNYLSPSQAAISSWSINNDSSTGRQLHQLIDKLNNN